VSPTCRVFPASILNTFFDPFRPPGSPTARASAAPRQHSDSRSWTAWWSVARIPESGKVPDQAFPRLQQEWNESSQRVANYAFGPLPCAVQSRLCFTAKYKSRQVSTTTIEGDRFGFPCAPKAPARKKYRDLCPPLMAIRAETLGGDPSPYNSLSSLGSDKSLPFR